MRKRETRLHPRRTALLMAVYAFLLALGAALPLASSYSQSERARARIEPTVEPSNALVGT